MRANTILALFAAGAVITVCFLLFLTPLLKLMGASGNLLTAAEQYGRIMIAGGVHPGFILRACTYIKE